MQVESALQRLAWAHEQGAAPLLTDLVAADRESWRPDAPLTRQVGQLQAHVVPDGRAAAPDAGRGGPATPLSQQDSVNFWNFGSLKMSPLGLSSMVSPTTA